MGKTIILEAPDGGWGIIVCIGMSLPLICIIGSVPSFALIFGDFLKSIGAETSEMAFITSTIFCSQSFSGLFANSLFKRFSIRIVGLVGGVLFFIGSVMQIYVKTTFELTVAYSLVQGVAAGLIFPSSFTTFNSYFVKKRVMMMSFSQTLIGIGTMFYPVVVQKLNEWYGFRGSLLVLAAINSHAILGMIVMQPVEWHMKKVQISDDEIEKDRSEPLLDTGKHVSQNSPDLRPNENLSSRIGSYVSVANWNGPIIMSAASVETQSLPKRASCWQFVVEFLDLSLLKDPIYLNIILGMSFAFYSDVAFFTFQPMYLFELNYTKMETANIIAIGAAADLVSRVVLTLSAIFVTTSSRYIYLAGVFFTFITRFVSNIVAIGVAADLISRVVLALRSINITASSYTTFQAGLFFTFVIRFEIHDTGRDHKLATVLSVLCCFPLVVPSIPFARVIMQAPLVIWEMKTFLEVLDFTNMAIVTAILGFLRTWIHVTIPLVFGEFVPAERYTSAYGLFMFIQGNITFLVGPIVGYIRDRTQDYVLTFHCLNFFLALCVVPWLIEIVYIKCRNHRKRIDNVYTYTN